MFNKQEIDFLIETESEFPLTENSNLFLGKKPHSIQEIKDDAAFTTADDKQSPLIEHLKYLLGYFN